MKIDITGYNDLGKYAYGTGVSMDGDVFDTDEHKIYILGSEDPHDAIEFKIECAEDLCKVLWCIPGVSIGNKSWFGRSLTTWWHSRYDDVIAADEKKYAALQKRIQREQDPAKREKLERKLTMYDPSNLKDIVTRYDERMARITEAIIARNS